MWLPHLVFAAGLGQIILIVASLAIPRTLGWRALVVWECETEDSTLLRRKLGRFLTK